MASIRHIRTVLAQPDLGLHDAGPGFSDVLLDGALLYGVRPDDMGLEVRGTDNAFSLLDRGAVVAGSGLDAPRQLLMAQMDGDDVLLSYGRYGREIEAYRLGVNGDVAGRFTLTMEGGTPGALTALAVTDDSGMVITAARQGAGLTVWQRDGDTLQRLSHIGSGELATANDIFDLSLVEIGNKTRVLAVSSDGNTLLNFALGGNGRLSDLEVLGAGQGLFVSQPDHLETVQLGGQTYALVGSSGSGSIAVVALAVDGGMVLRDHVGDDLATRFQGLSVLEAVTVAGQVYVVAGGADDGLSLLTLLPDGRLLHLDTLPHAVGMALDNPAGLALIAGAGGIDIAASGNTVSGQAGLSHLRVDLGTIGETVLLGAGADRFNGGNGRDQIAGGAGNDTLSGGGGDDVLIDGDGSDQLRGGAGADVFVLVADGRSDRIQDFQIGVDRLDLSQMGQFYTVAGMNIRSTDTGARIDLGGERLWIDTADGAPLQVGDFTTGDLRDLWHISFEAPPEPQRPQPVTVIPEPEPVVLPLTPTPDTTPDKPVPVTPYPDPLPVPDPVPLPVTPPASPDASRYLTGGEVGYSLVGGTGNDILIGDAGDAALDAVAAQVYRLYSATLDRAPDLPGLQTWVDRFTSGETTLTQAAGRFVASTEFGKTYGNLDNDNFIRLLYQNVLGRDPDPGGFANWTGLLDSGARSRASVVEGFSQSREFVAKTAVDALAYGHVRLQAEYSDEVFRLYGATLDRVPDEGGFRDWTDRLAQGRDYGDAIAGFVSSREFIRNYGDTSDTGFVRLLYANVLDRSPDAAGQAHWLRKMSVEGWSREDVVEAFAQSREFVAKTKSEMINWARDIGPDDVLYAGGGNDVLMGGLLSDNFVFSAATGGRAEVLDYEPWDRLVFNDFGYSSDAAARAHMRQSGADVVFADQGVEVVLVDTLLEDVLF